LITEDQLVRKEWLERTNRELQRELQVREDLIKMRLEKVGKAHKKVEDERQAKRQAKSEKKRLDMITMMENLGIVQSKVATSLRDLVSSTTTNTSADKAKDGGLLPSVVNNNTKGGVKVQVTAASSTASAKTWVSNKTAGVVPGRSSIALSHSIESTPVSTNLGGGAVHDQQQHGSMFVVDGIDLRELLLMKDEVEYFSDIDD
jgi:hypothetical protein